MIPLKLITNRNLCKDLSNQIERTLCGHKKQQILRDFHIESLILREKDLSQEEYKELLQKICPICKKYSIDFFVHTFWQMGLEEGIKNVHLPLPMLKKIRESEEEKEKFFGKYRNIGVSVHSIEEAKEAEILGASYVLAGHIFPTACKKDLEPRGLDFLEDICQEISIPVYALGGIGENNAHLALGKGAYGVGMMSVWMQAGRKK